MYAIIDEGGRQHKITAGDTLHIDRPADDDVKTITFDRVLLIAGEGEPKIGLPLLAGADGNSRHHRSREGKESPHCPIPPPQGLPQDDRASAEVPRGEDHRHQRLIVPGGTT